MNREHVYFENYAATWDRDRKEDPKKLAWIINLLALPPDGCILDAGSGTGILVPYLRNALTRGGHIEELDYSGRMLDRARQKFGTAPDITYTEGDILKVSLPEKHYDAILCLNVYPHIGCGIEAFIKKAVHALKPGGCLAIFHDQSREKTNQVHQDGNQVGPAVLPPVDVLEMQFISAGLSITIAMDTDTLYLVKGEKKEIPAPAKGEPGISSQHPHTETKKVINRLARISGHLEGIRHMVEEDRDCSEILMQISAVDAALISTGKVILQDHISHCLVDAVHHNDQESIEKLQKAIGKLIK